MGKPEEAFSISLNAKDNLFVNDALSIDDLTLSTLQIVFQRIDRCKHRFSFFNFLGFNLYILSPNLFFKVNQS